MEKEFVRSGSRLVWLILLCAIAAVLATRPVFADQSAAVSWDPSTDPNVVGYNVYYGPNSLNYTNLLPAGNSTSLLVAGLVEGATYYFAATAYDFTGVESDLSNEVVYSVPGGGTNNATLPPTISAIGSQSIQTNSTLASVPFVIGDPDSVVDSLTLSAYSSYPGLVPVANIVFGGTGAERTVQITPAANASGTATIGIIVTDESGNNAVAQFALTVLAGSGNPGASPVIVGLSDLILIENSSGTNLSFAVSDTDTPVANLSASVSADNSSLFPYGNAVLSGAGASRVLRLIPALNQTGVSRVSVYASDDTGHATTNTITVVVVPDPMARTLTLLTNGNGTISPDLAARTLTVGKVYSITAKPALGNLFVGWAGDLASTSPKLTFTLVSNMVLQASFIPDPVYLSGGSYSGLFAESAGVRVGSAGYFTASLTRSGKYSGRVKVGGGSYPISGKINFQCQATNHIKRGTNLLTLEFRADQAGHLYGQVSQDTWLAPLEANRAVVHPKSSPAPQAGRYTFLLPGQAGDPVLPEGHSYGTVKVSAGGVTSIVGTLADGTKISQGITLSEDGFWPIYFPLYAGKGVAVGWQAFTAKEDSDFDGWMVWIKQADSAARFYQAGFEYQRHLYGLTYLPPTGTNAVLNVASYIDVPFGGGNLAANFDNAITLGRGNTITNLSANKLSLQFSTATGLFSGKVTDRAENKTWAFGGAILQKENVGYGFLTGTNKSSIVALYPH